jgi:hypothetical protein
MFSLKSLLLIVAVAAIGTAGLIHRTQLWASALLAITLGVVLLAACRAWFVPKTRAFWGPFALTGAVYLAIVSLQPLVELHYNLPTTQLVTYALEKLQDKAATQSPRPAVTPYYSSSASAYAAPTTTFAPDVTQYAPSPTPAPADSGEQFGSPAAESGGSIEVRRPVEVVTQDPVTNSEKRETQEVVEVWPDPSAAQSGMTVAAPSVPPPTVFYAAPVYSPVSYNRQMIFQMATTLGYGGYGNNFASEARAFLCVAQCLWCLLVSFAMGMTCSWLFRSVQSTRLDSLTSPPVRPD